MTLAAYCGNHPFESSPANYTNAINLNTHCHRWGRYFFIGHRDCTHKNLNGTILTFPFIKTSSVNSPHYYYFVSRGKFFVLPFFIMELKCFDYVSLWHYADYSRIFDNKAYSYTRQLCLATVSSNKKKDGMFFYANLFGIAIYLHNRQKIFRNTIYFVLFYLLFGPLILSLHL